MGQPESILEWQQLVFTLMFFRLMVSILFVVMCYR